MTRVRRDACARAGLLGNPSDIFGGRVISLALANFRAAVEIESADRFEIVPGADDRLAYPSLREAAAAFDAFGCDDGVRLLRAALRKLVELRGGLGDLRPDDPRLAFRISYRTDIPRQVGFSGSSAIVIAALRALADWFALPLGPSDLADAALACETDDLGIAAGPQDRVIQAHEGLLFMDFAAPRTPSSYRRIDPSLLPPLFVAWDPRGGAPSRVVHSDARARHQRGDTELRDTIAALAAIADEGLRCLESGDTAGLLERIERSTEVRAQAYPLSDTDRALIEHAREHGAVAKLCGSGGAVIGGLRDDSGWARLEAAYRAAGYAAERARVALPTQSSGA